MAEQRVARRRPRQLRSLHKVALMLEATMQLLDEGGLETLNTNAIAAKAGVSVGTLYQYFSGKEAILEALAEREMAVLSERITAVVRDRRAKAPSERLARIVRAVMDCYGRRDRVHRIVMEHSLARGARRLLPTLREIIAVTAEDETLDAGPLDRTEAFVATHAVVGVLRAVIQRDIEPPPLPDIERAIARMLVGLRNGRDG